MAKNEVDGTPPPPPGYELVSNPFSRRVRAALLVAAFCLVTTGVVAMFVTHRDVGPLGLVVAGVVLVVFGLIGDRIERLDFAGVVLVLQSQALQARERGDDEQAQALEQSAHDILQTVWAARPILRERLAERYRPRNTYEAAALTALRAALLEAFPQSSPKVHDQPSMVPDARIDALVEVEDTAIAVDFRAGPAFDVERVAQRLYYLLGTIHLCNRLLVMVNSDAGHSNLERLRRLTQHHTVKVEVVAWKPGDPISEVVQALQRLARPIDDD